MLGLYIVKLALFEVLAMVGFFLAVVKGTLVLIVPFLLLSLFGFAVSYPDNDQLRGRIR